MSGAKRSYSLETLGIVALSKSRLLHAYWLAGWLGCLFVASIRLSLYIYLAFYLTDLTSYSPILEVARQLAS